MNLDLLRHDNSQSKFTHLLEARLHHYYIISFDDWCHMLSDLVSLDKMTKSLREHIAQHFASALAIRSGFKRHEEASTFLSRFDVAFTRMPRMGRSYPFIVLLYDHRARSRLSVEIGWSADPKFPRCPIRPSGEASVGRNEFEEPYFLARLSTLWGEPDAWWDVAAAADVSKVIGVVMSRLEGWGFPYLEEKEGASKETG